jgi:anti-sigma factor RsiW
MSDVASQLTDREMAELCALADGSLPDERRAAVEAWIAADPALRELLDRQRQSVAATQALANDPVPASLQATVEGRRTRPSSRQGRTRRFVPRLAFVGAIALVVAVVAALLTGGPGAPNVAEAARLTEQAATAPAPPPRDGSATQLAEDVDGVVFPNFLESYGWQAVGLRRDEINGRDATTVFYEKDGKQIAYVIVSGSGLNPPKGAPSTTRDDTVFHTFSLNGKRAVTWQRLGHTCILVGPVSNEELQTLAGWRGNGALSY